TDPAVTTTSLVVTAGPLRGTSLTLGSTPILIGRAPECTLVLDDDYASNRHARIFRREDEWLVEDLGSTNGTLVSGRHIEGSVPFRPGAQVRIGRTEIELRRGPRCASHCGMPPVPTSASCGPTTRTPATPAATCWWWPTGWAGTPAATAPPRWRSGTCPVWTPTPRPPTSSPPSRRPCSRPIRRSCAAPATSRSWPVWAPPSPRCCAP